MQIEFGASARGNESIAAVPIEPEPTLPLEKIDQFLEFFDCGDAARVESNYLMEQSSALGLADTSGS
ncbi:MAG: hypothetical protein AAF961_17785 [Planctomycetota bacterium]